MRITVLVACLVLSACAASGPSFDLTNLNKPRDGSKIVIYRPSGFIASGRSPSVEINGVKSCEMPQGSFFSKDINPGPVNLSVTLWDSPGTTRYSIIAKPGKTHFVKISPNKANILAGSSFGIAGMMMEGANSEQGGQFIFTEEPEQKALETLKTTKESISCD